MCSYLCTFLTSVVYTWKFSSLHSLNVLLYEPEVIQSSNFMNMTWKLLFSFPLSRCHNKLWKRKYEIVIFQWTLLCWHAILSAEIFIQSFICPTRDYCGRWLIQLLAMLHGIDGRSFSLCGLFAFFMFVTESYPFLMFKY